MISNKKWKELKAEYKNSGSTIQEGNSFFIFSKDEMKHVQNLPKKCTYDHYLDIQHYSQDKVHHGLEKVYIIGDGGIDFNIECQFVGKRYGYYKFSKGYCHYDRGDGTFLDTIESKSFNIPKKLFKKYMLKRNHYYRLMGSIVPYYYALNKNGYKKEYIDYHFGHDYLEAEEIKKYTIPTDQELADKASARMVEDVLEEQMPWLQYM